MFLVSMADIIGSYERLPNDAVRAVAVAKRREYKIARRCGVTSISKSTCTKTNMFGPPLAVEMER